jgi:DNA-binding SARP family transcriptional activator/tetratricopeptide (TPR) repeat protein
MLGILWPESEPDRARHALSQTLYSLKGDLGVEVVLAGTDLRLDSSLLPSDLDDFRAAFALKDWAHAALLYKGPFADGFYLTDAPEFERWVEEARSRLAHDGARAIEQAAKDSMQSGQVELAVEYWRRLTELEPLNSQFAASYMKALFGYGDRAGALAHGKAHGEVVRRELETEPDPDVGQLVAKLRAGGEAVLDQPEATAHPRNMPPTEAPGTSAPPRWAPPSLRRAGAIVLVAAVVIGSVIVWRQQLNERAVATPVLAVGRIQDLVTPDPAQLGGVLSEMLATSLGRLADVQVIANSRILELVPRDADTDRAARTAAAKRAGATQVLEGELIPLADRRLRLELRRVDITRGIVRAGYQIDGTDRLVLFDSITALIAADFRLAAPTGTLAAVSTRSPIAYRLYEEGLRAFYQYDSHAANRLFLAAIKEDSTFAMATYYAWRSAVAVNGNNQDALAERAIALASRASDHDRLLIQTHVGRGQSDPGAAVAAESLVTRYPNEPEALMRGAEVISDLARATALLNRSIALDSAAGVGATAVCRLCEAFSALETRYDWADSIAGVELTIRRWSRLQPSDYRPWSVLADYLTGVGRRTDAQSALRRADSLGAPQEQGNELQLARSLRSDDLETANTICRTGLESADAQLFRHYQFTCTIMLRMAGRYRDALALALEGKAPDSRTPRRGESREIFHNAILDMEMGRPLAAAVQFASFATEASKPRNAPPGIIARNVAWYLTLSGTASAAAHDTIRVRILLDSVQATGRRSLFPRDPRLHHFLRGLLLARAGQHEQAVREYRAAIYSPSEGFTRINYELGRSLLALNRPAEAVAALRPPLHGGIEGSGLYLTRTETHELLAQAFDAAGQRDSAAAHFAIVERAWRGADPVMRPRYDAARQWLMRAGRLGR